MSIAFHEEDHAVMDAELAKRQAPYKRDCAAIDGLIAIAVRQIEGGLGYSDFMKTRLSFGSDQDAVNAALLLAATMPHSGCLPNRDRLLEVVERVTKE